MTVYADPGAIGNVVGTSGSIEATWGNAIKDRVVHRFASTAARDAAIVSPTEGMLCYVTADNCYYGYNGSAWEVRGYTGALPSYTPSSVSQNIAVTFTNNYVALNRMGHLCTVIGSLAITSAGSAGFVIGVALPFTSVIAGVVVGSAFFYDASSGINHPAHTYINAAGTFTLLDTTQTTGGVFLGQAGSAFSGAVASGDAILFNLSYETTT